MAKPTIRDIAEKLKISQAAVSLALRGREGVSEATRERVIETARSMRYDLPVRAKRSVPHRNIALLTDGGDGPLRAYVLKSLSDVCAEDGGVLRVFSYSQWKNEPRLLAGCETLLLFDTLPREDLEVLSSAVPHLLLLDGDYPRAPFSNLRVGYSDAAYAMTKYLSELGHRSILYVNADLPMSKNLLFFNGFQQLVLELRLPLDSSQIVMDLDGSPNVFKHFPDIIRRRNISAVICTSASCAYRMASQLSIMGFRVPEDISVAAVTGDEPADIPGHALTRISMGFREFGRKAAEIAVSGDAGQDLVIPCSPVIGGSSVAAPKYNPASKKLAFVLYRKDHPTLLVARAGFLNMAQQMGYQAEIAGITDDDEEAFCRVCRELAQQRIDGVALWLSPPDAIKSFREANIPIVCLHGVTKDMPPGGWQASIAGDPQEIAQSVSSYFAAHLPKKGGRVSVSQSSHNPLEDSITRALIGCMREKCPRVTVTQDLLFADHSEESVRAVTEFMRNTPDLLGVFSTAGFAAITWSHVRRLLGRDITIIGTDYDEESIELLKQGELDAFVAQPIYEESQESVTALDTILRGNVFPAVTTLEAPLVTAQNVEKYDLLVQYVRNFYV